MNPPTFPAIEPTETGFADTPDGHRIRWRHYAAANPQRSLLIVHGLAEHGERYGNLIDHAVPQGTSCWTLDLRGHGDSDGRQVHVTGFDDYLLDVSAVFGLLQASAAGHPCFVLGHSMGGLVVLRWLLQQPNGVDGAILSSPALGSHADSDPPWVLDRLARVLSRVAPGMLFPSDLPTDAISRDPAVVAAYRADPRVSSKVSARWYTEVRSAMADTRSRAETLSVPMLLMQSGADRLVDPAATRRWASHAPSKLVESVVWPGFFHEMLNEPEHGQVLSKIDTWLDRQAAS